MKALKIITVILALAGGAAEAAGPPFQSAEEKFIFSLIGSFFANDAAAYYALTQRFVNPQYKSLEQVVDQMNHRFAPRSAVLESEYGPIPVVIHLMTETVDEIRLIRVEPHFQEGARVYNVAVMITRQFQVASTSLVLRQIVAHKVYVIYKGDTPDNFVDFEDELDMTVTEGRIL